MTMAQAAVVTPVVPAPALLAASRNSGLVDDLGPPAVGQRLAARQGFVTGPEAAVLAQVDLGTGAGLRAAALQLQPFLLKPVCTGGGCC
jgi:hypothetical protein